MILKLILLAIVFIYLDQTLSNEDKGQSKRTKRSMIDEIKNATFKKVEVSFDGIQEIERLSNFKTGVECAAFCLASSQCFAFQWDSYICKVLAETGLCLDVQNTNPVSVYVDQDKLPALCQEPAYKGYVGLCLNKNGAFEDLGHFTFSSLITCQQKCDQTVGCGAVSWSGSTCYLLSAMESTQSNYAYNCYIKESPYVILPYGQLCNKYGDRVLTTFEECEIAATKLNINPPTSEDNSFYPKGCYVHGSSGSSVYFNLHSTGNAHGSMRPICKLSGCGDYLETIADSNGQKFLGTVSLSSLQTYASCRRLCLANYPDFEFYHKFINYQSCDCFKMELGFKIKTSVHGAYTFGYAATCKTFYDCNDFEDGPSSSNYDKYCYKSKIDSQEFCIGQSGTNTPIQCTNINEGIRFTFDVGGSYPMRFNKKGETVCQNYHPDYLENLARSLGFSSYRVDVKKSGNSCALVWLDSNGNFQISTGNSLIEKPYDVSFWGPLSDDGYEFLMEGTNIACGNAEQIESSQNVDEAGCKNKCDADNDCTYLWTRSQNQKCILFSSCDTLVDYPLSSGKLFKKKLG